MTPDAHSTDVAAEPTSGHPQDPHRIRAMFDAVAPRYDVMNDIMSFGIHRRWKRRLRRMAGKPWGRGLALDLAGGTGDIASELSNGGWAVVVCDASEGMMSAGRDSKAGPRIRWVGGDAQQLPFPDGTFDLVTLGFGLRNFQAKDTALAEVARVLAPGGRFLCLEFSTPMRPIRGIYRAYSRRMIPRIGAAVAGKPEAYRYLVDSIADFADQKTVAGWLEAAGLTEVRYRNLMFGIAAIHDGRRAAARP